MNHPFVQHPHRTLLAQSLPVLLSLVAEPLAGLADTAFVARLGAAPVASLGVATMLLSSIFWVFNFLGIGTQTEVAKSAGADRDARAAEMAGLAVVLAALLGLLLAIGLWPFLDRLAELMGARAQLRDGAVVYLRIRLLGAPAVLMMIAVFGALRGLQNMRTPFRIAFTINLANVVLDAVLIFGLGPIPAFGIAGAAWATVMSQWLGAVWAFLAIRSQPGIRMPSEWSRVFALLVVGRDLFVRSGALLLFLMLTTRLATRIGADAGAAHQAIRQVWVLAALLLDAFAITAQSLVGFFLGAGETGLARRVARVACLWGLACGVAITVAMWLGEGALGMLLVPPSALALYSAAWLPAAAAQPLNALSFVTDGIHWGAGDYRYLRNGMLLSSGLGTVVLFLIDPGSENALVRVWCVTGGWIAVRAVIGVVRIWPGVGAAPLRAVALARGESGSPGRG